MQYEAQSISEIIQGEHIIPFPNRKISELAYDSRKIFMPAQSLFFALHTEKQNGHKYIEDAYQQGVKNFVVADAAPFQIKYPDANYFIAKDTLGALQTLAAAHRSHFQIPIIGITGSNGKTTTKEWLFQLLNEQMTVKRNPKSYNSQIGVPLSVWNLDETDEIGIFEAGISRKGEMDHLQKIIQPTIGIITNIGPAHDEGFASRQEKLHEKLRLFHNASQLIYCRDHTAIHQAIEGLKKNNPSLQTIHWGKSHEADIQVALEDNNLECRHGENDFSIALPFTDKATIENAMHCVGALIALGLNPADFSDGFSEITHLPLRLELKEGINNCNLIYDCYNSDLRSLKIALDFQKVHHQSKRKTIILSDILESGQKPDELYQEVARLLESKKITRLIGIGPAISQYLPDHLPSYIDSAYYPDTSAFLKEKLEDHFNSESILLKGARKFQFERIGAILEQKVHGTKLEINLAAITNNLNVYRKQLPEHTKLMAMVKAFSYGTGSYEIANILQYHHVDYLSVAYADEGVSLRKSDIHLPIMVLNSDEDSMAAIIRYDLEPEIFSLGNLKQHIRATGQFGLEGKTYPIHLKIDTGMHRLGLEESELKEAIHLIKENKQVQVATVFSHLAAADDPEKDEATLSQIQRFEKAATFLQQQLDHPPLLHLANSVGMLRFPQAHYDMVRLGLGLYGLDLSNTVQSQLQQVATLTTTIAQIKQVPAGHGIGYGFLDKAAHPRQIATVNIGYADGYNRHFSQGVGYMIIHGFKAPVVGNVCMDMTMLDVTNIPDVKEGDEVQVFGENLPLKELADLIETIPYEIIATLSGRVKRVYVDE